MYLSYFLQTARFNLLTDKGNHIRSNPSPYLRRFRREYIHEAVDPFCSSIPQP
ncbi:pollen-specific leucine-rich repeat extensin-like protein 3 [Iris pallida]|uniref:Pollen-specific leucine-rich repeat extensin-like protein 3 n=1 Tax=Iris pallida TaxID=29817 RepID=A0AAX6H8A5_IRIPA|nr:pollen-specific leucine-rich repeat extensin-like protein 3 [Iris pallida]